MLALAVVPSTKDRVRQVDCSKERMRVEDSILEEYEAYHRCLNDTRVSIECAHWGHRDRLTYEVELQGHGPDSRKAFIC